MEIQRKIAAKKKEKKTSGILFQLINREKKRGQH